MEGESWIQNPPSVFKLPIKNILICNYGLSANTHCKLTFSRNWMSSEKEDENYRDFIIENAVCVYLIASQTYGTLDFHNFNNHVKIQGNIGTLGFLFKCRCVRQL